MKNGHWQQKDIPDWLVVHLAWSWRFGSHFRGGEPTVLDALVKLGIPKKLALQKMWRLHQRGILDFDFDPACMYVSETWVEDNLRRDRIFPKRAKERSPEEIKARRNSRRKNKWPHPSQVKGTYYPPKSTEEKDPQHLLNGPEDLVPIIKDGKTVGHAKFDPQSPTGLSFVPSEDYEPAVPSSAELADDYERSIQKKKSGQPPLSPSPKPDIEIYEVSLDREPSLYPVDPPRVLTKEEFQKEHPHIPLEVSDPESPFPGP